MYEGYRAKPKTIGFESTLVLMVLCPAPYFLIWQPVRRLPAGRVRFWEYVCELPDSDLEAFSQLDDASFIRLDLARIESKIDNLLS